MVPPLPGKVTTVLMPAWPLAQPHAAHHRAVLSLSAPPFYLSPHIHSYSYPFSGSTEDAMRDKHGRNYLTSNLGDATSLPSSRERPTQEITTQTSTLPNFYLAQPKECATHFLTGRRLGEDEVPRPHGGGRLHAEQGGFACTKPSWWCALSYQVQTGGKLHPLGGRRLRPF